MVATQKMVTQNKATLNLGSQNAAKSVTANWQADS